MYKIILISILSFFYHVSYGQDCEVRLEILKNYTGECKKGLAHGKGRAIGEDFEYIGEFKKGLPHGEGKIISSDSSILNVQVVEGMVYGYGEMTYADSIQRKGYWKGAINKFRLMGESKEALAGYRVVIKDNLSEALVRISNKENNSDKLTIRLNDAKNRSIASVEFLERSGGQISNSNITNSSVTLEITNIQFPFNGTLRYMVSNESGNFSLPVILQFELLESGSWMVTITH